MHLSKQIFHNWAVRVVNTNTLRLVRFLFLFFARRLFLHKVMQSSCAKILLFFTALASYAGYCFLTFIVVRGMVFSSKAVSLVCQSISMTVGLWVLLFFIIIRVLFMKADKLIELTHTLPVTNKQRILAYTIFEAITVLSCVSLVSGPLTFSMAIRGGCETFPEIFFGIIGQIVILYLLLDVIYLGFDRFLQVFHIERWRSFLIPCFFGSILFSAYMYVQRESNIFLDAFYEGRTYYGFSRFFVLIYDKFGVLTAGVVFLVSAVIVLLVILIVAPNQHSRWKYFFKIPLGNSPSLFIIHLKAIVRSGEFLLATFFVITLSIVVLGIHEYYPPYWLAIISTQAVYALPTTEAIHKTYRHKLSPCRLYLYLFAPYALAESVIGVPVLAISAIKGLNLAEVGKTIFICMITLIASIAISIFFPAEKHNPFSVLVGMITALCLVILISFTIFVWQIPGNITVLLWLSIGAVCIFHSIMGINSTQRKEYYEYV